MDPEIEELKELVRHNTKLVEDTNKVVHGMRRSQRMRTFLSLVWWFFIIGASSFAYYYLLGPYMGQLMQLYGNAQSVLQNFHPQ